MKFSEKTLAKVVANLVALLKWYLSLPYEMLKLHISSGNRKIGRVFNFSTAPIITCGNCKACKGYCYDVKACLQYPGTRKARAENTAMMLKDMRATFEQIDAFLSRKHKRQYFRWHVAGEILSKAYLSLMVWIAKRHPTWRFWTYTKMYELVNTYCDENGGRDAIPENLTIMFSIWHGVPCDNRYNFPVFVCIMDGDTIPEGATHCPGNCDYCIEGHTGCVFGKSAYTFPH